MSSDHSSVIDVLYKNAECASFKRLATLRTAKSAVV